MSSHTESSKPTLNTEAMPLSVLNNDDLNLNRQNDTSISWTSQTDNISNVNPNNSTSNNNTNINNNSINNINNNTNNIDGGPSRKPFVLGGHFFLLNWLQLWIFPLVRQCRKQADIHNLQLVLASFLTAEKNGQDLDATWKREQTNAVVASRSPNILRALYNIYGTKYILVGLWKLIWAGCTWTGAYYFLRHMIEVMEKDESSTTGQMFAMGLLLTSIGSSIAIHQLYSQCNALGIQVRASISVLIYRKMLVLARIRGGAGEIINIISTDVARIVEAVTNFHFLWSAIVETIVIIVLAFPTVKWQAALSAMALIIIILPVQIYLGYQTSNIQIKQTAVTTQRVHLMSEILTAIKLIKCYAWETPFQAEVDEIRAKELHLFKRNLQVKACNMAVVFALPVIVSVTALSVYNGKRTGPLDSSVVFTALSIFNTLRYPLLMLPMAVKSTSGAVLSIRRLNDYLTQSEIEQIEERTAEEGGDTAFEVQNGEFTWDGDESKPALSGINLKANRGEIVAIIGDVGSGKSSFIAALLGQIRQSNNGPQLKIYGKSSYVPQEAWLINVNLRENIVFGKEFDQERYNTVIKVCALERDLTLLSHGDMTEIGERGSNLSGGQKQRVSLARAVYHKSDIVLMDDPLSAVDQNVGRQIFDQCIRGFLSDRTVVLATHQLQYLHRCDKIVMLQHGKIAYQGTYDELMSNEPSFSALINTHVSQENEVDDDYDDYLCSETAKELMSASTILDESPMVDNANKQRRHTLSTSTLFDDTTGSIVGQAGNEGLPGDSIHQLHRTLSNPSRHSILGSTLRERKSLHMINNIAGNVDFSTAVDRNEMSVYSLQDDRIFKSNHRHSASGVSKRRSKAISIDSRNKIGHEGQGSSNSEKVNKSYGEEKELEDDGEDENGTGALIGADKSMDEMGLADYIKYLRAGSGSLATIVVIIMFFIAHGVRMGSDYWLRLWVPNSLNTSSEVYLGVYGAFIAAFATLVLIRGLCFAHVVISKSKSLHDRAFKSIMRAPMSFFETNSLGRILSAFSKSMFTVDDTLPDAGLMFLQYFPLALGSFVMMAVVVGWQNAVTAIGLLLIAIGFVWYGGPADTKLKQMDALSRPPVFQHISTTLEGLFSIRAYGVQSRFDGMNMVVLDTNHESNFAMMSARTWIAFYLDIISSCMIYCTALFLVIYRYDIHEVSSVTGLALSNAMQMLVFLQWTVRQMGEIQSQISTIGQLDYYGKRIEPEALAENPDTKPHPSWPQEGKIEFDHLSLKYRKDSPPVLKDVSFTISPQEKVGIVGRTGSGKSTLLVGLLRIVEAHKGNIRIDGIDISTLGLNDLRTRVGIIPQEPVLFVGTVRSNLDPFNRSNDNDIWKALDAVHLGDRIRALPLKLESPVVENGKNYSLGQRQLICIARSLVIGAKIIVLDEATASIDMVTDKMLQETIKQSFVDCTVLTIAHRLNTIIESDKVLVMDGGIVAEFGEPYKLLQNPSGIFAELVNHAGEAASKKLMIIAKDAHLDRNKKLDKGY